MPLDAFQQLCDESCRFCLLLYPWLSSMAVALVLHVLAILHRVSTYFLNYLSWHIMCHRLAICIYVSSSNSQCPLNWHFSYIRTYSRILCLCRKFLIWCNIFWMKWKPAMNTLQRVWGRLVCVCVCVCVCV